jgi:hypothetical protein
MAFFTSAILRQKHLFQGKRQRFAEIAKIAGKKDHRPQLQV